MTKDEALKLALEAFGEINWSNNSQWQSDRAKVAIATLKEALANEALEKMAENARELGLDYEPEQPKVRTGNCLRVGVCASEGHKIAPQRTWVGLTEKDICEVAVKSQDGISPRDDTLRFAIAIEAKLRSKNS